MPKRNFSDFSESPYTPHDRSQSLQVTRLFQKFEYGVMTLSKALKVARGFERQKLGRREKTAQKEEGGPKEGTLSRIAEEIQVVKTLDPHATAEKYLFKQLSKTKRIAESPVFIQFKEKKKITAEGPKSTAEANVTARLYKSTPVKNVFPGIMEGIRKLLGIEDKQQPAGGDVKGGEKRKKETKEKPTKEEKSSKKKDSSEAVSSKRTSASAEPEAEAELSGDEDINMDDAGSEADSIDFAQFDSRLAPDSGDEDEDEDEDHSRDISDGISDEEEEEDDDQHIHSHQSNISISRSPSPDSPPAKKPKGSSKASSTPATSTTFLPSLTMGGYWSGSESEAEDGEAANEPPRRKNRMGQQARRALWEKKYGSGANHVKQEMNKNRRNGGRDSGWDPRRGATGGGDRWGRGGGQHGGRGRPQQRDQQYGRPQRDGGGGGGGGFQKKPEDNKPLHPSWEAARKAKEQKATAAFQGKKVTFD
ncbi:hypothetical protein AbraIFM66951_012009 [Aspergillus brasiliensis]|uniref:Bud22 domain-containing protein n=1 Tax=Aspergillus brasiliensis TaxID=319629 RepID=A0A9W6DR26_9EURO|nr:hypothetical protein AbraCBS73388_011593 [Aspergillus brasiliensis]GKZ48246.1 hypothetical protein AbraIFM66951_012009 [Aspergillus brasiliensis]